MVGSGRPGPSRDVRVAFWQGIRAGSSVEQAASAAGVSAGSGQRWLRPAGGGKSNAPAPLCAGRYLSLAEREEIAVGLAAGRSLRWIAVSLGRAPSTVSREVARN